MRITLRRISAYFIDIILVSVIATVLASNPYLNKDYHKYQDNYNEYNSSYSNYNKYKEKIESFYEDFIISNEEYNNLIKFDEYSNSLIDNYDDEKIEQEEYELIISDINKIYSKKNVDYNYKLLKYSIMPTIVSLMCILLYFVVFQFYFNGQTLGKKIMKLRIISNSDKELNIINYLIRSLIVNEVFINILNIIFLIILSKDNFISYNNFIYVITYCLEMVILFTVLFDKNNRGLHDYISNTKVIEEKKR